MAPTLAVFGLFSWRYRKYRPTLIFGFGPFLVNTFRRKTQTIAVTFLKTNEVTDFISWLPLAATLM